MDADSATETSTAGTGVGPETGPSLSAPNAATAPAETSPAGVTGDEPEWSPARVEEGTGIAIDGDGLPVNHRLRSERLALDGKETDPGGVVSDELIAESGKRLDSIRDAFKPVRANMKVADLERIAKDENVDLDGADNNEERVARIEAARPELPGMDSLKAHEEGR